ncbi:hypothetical protein [Legionella sp. WA2022007384]
MLILTCGWTISEKSLTDKPYPIYEYIPPLTETRIGLLVIDLNNYSLDIKNFTRSGRCIPSEIEKIIETYIDSGCPEIIKGEDSIQKIIIELYEQTIIPEELKDCIFEVMCKPKSLKEICADKVRETPETCNYASRTNGTFFYCCPIQQASTPPILQRYIHLGQSFDNTHYLHECTEIEGISLDSSTKKTIDSISVHYEYKDLLAIKMHDGIVANFRQNARSIVLEMLIGNISLKKCKTLLEREVKDEYWWKLGFKFLSAKLLKDGIQEEQKYQHIDKELYAQVRNCLDLDELEVDEAVELSANHPI